VVYVRDLTGIGEARGLIQRKNAQLALQFQVALLMSRARTPIEAATYLLEPACAATGWQCGALWVADGNHLQFTSEWHTRETDADAFITECRDARVQRGSGLLGRVWSTLATAWVEDLTQEVNDPQAGAAACAGLRSAVALPLLLQGRAWGVIELLSTAPKSRDQTLLSTLRSLGAQVSQTIERLEIFPAELSVGSGEPQAAAAMAAQEDLFRSRQTALEGELDIIRRSVRGLELQIRSLDQLKVGREKQIALFEERLAAYTMLQEEGWATRSQLIDIEGQLAEVQSKQSEDLANIAGIQAQLSEFRMRGVQRENEFRREVETQIAGVQQDVSTLAERIVALRDTHQRLAVKSPVDGVVVDVAFHTIGGIIKPGDRILDIVPEGDALTVEAQVAPHYIDRVHAGLEADVHFDAYMARAEQPVITGSVTVVSADALTNARTGEQYYSIRVSVSPAELEKLGSLTLQPGMTGTVMVKTGERSLLIYLMRPFLRRFSSALSEP
jgi:HlyD family type I secretion membrane fusion protein